MKKFLGNKSQIEKDLARMKRLAEIRSTNKTTDKGESGSDDGAVTKETSHYKMLRKPGNNRIKELVSYIITLLSLPRSATKESRALFPDEPSYILEAFVKQKEFLNWFKRLRSLPESVRVQELKKMSAAMRIDANNAEIADFLDRLDDRTVFIGFVEALEELALNNCEP